MLITQWVIYRNWSKAIGYQRRRYEIMLFYIHAACHIYFRLWHYLPSCQTYFLNPVSALRILRSGMGQKSHLSRACYIPRLISDKQYELWSLTLRFLLPLVNTNQVQIHSSTRSQTSYHVFLLGWKKSSHPQWLDVCYKFQVCDAVLLTSQAYGFWL